MSGGHVHLRVPYYRATVQGGDTQQPLCLAPLTGWAGPLVARLPMVDQADGVSCAHCRSLLLQGGLAKRFARAEALRR